jgi:hypothetical protein
MGAISARNRPDIGQAWRAHVPKCARRPQKVRKFKKTFKKVEKTY